MAVSSLVVGRREEDKGSPPFAMLLALRGLGSKFDRLVLRVRANRANVPPRSRAAAPTRFSVDVALDRMKLKHLESALSSVTTYSQLGTDKVNIELEQYSTSAHLAARMVYTAEFEFGDIEGRNVLDLGCGTGMLGIAAGILGAATVTGLDVDSEALMAAAENADDMGVDMDLVRCDVARNPCVPERFDVVLMNPPFGTRRAGIDVIFLERALEAASTVYSMHKTSTRKHLLKKADEWGVDVTVLAQLRFDIPATYKFHKRNSVDIEVDLIRLQRRLVRSDSESGEAAVVEGKGKSKSKR